MKVNVLMSKTIAFEIEMPLWCKKIFLHSRQYYFVVDTNYGNKFLLVLIINIIP